MEYKNVKIVVFVPLSHADIVRKAIGNADGGIIGNYSYCSFSSKGTGRFTPNNEANPHIGSIGIPEEVEEERIEFVCPRTTAKSVVSAIKKVHPYEEIALDIYPLTELGDL